MNDYKDGCMPCDRKQCKIACYGFGMCNTAYHPGGSYIARMAPGVVGFAYKFIRPSTRINGRCSYVSYQ